MARSMVRAHPNSVGPSGNLNVRSASIASVWSSADDFRSSFRSGHSDMVTANDMAACSHGEGVVPYRHVGVVLRMIWKSRQSSGALILTPTGPNHARGIGHQSS